MYIINKYIYFFTLYTYSDTFLRIRIEILKEQNLFEMEIVFTYAFEEFNAS